MGVLFMPTHKANITSVENIWLIDCEQEENRFDKAIIFYRLIDYSEQ